MHTFMASFDDEYCDEGNLGRSPGEFSLVLARMLRAAEAPEIEDFGGDRYAAALRDLRLRLGRYASPVQVSRWVSALRLYFFFLVWEAGHRSRGSVPDLDEYAMSRIDTGSMRTHLMVLDVIDGYEVPATEMEQIEVRALVEIMATVIGWDNDIFSQYKESVRDSGSWNLISILARERHYSHAEALTDAVAMRDRVVTLFLLLRAKVSAHASAELRRYLESVGGWIPANIDWSLTSGRYPNPDDLPQFADFLAAGPSDTSTQPLPIPSIAWWWGLLGD
ncbi:MAG TPA: hypothetical protein VHX38_33280 [Pseudonocardiaceae bacterium]|nr:hypothetical protein [Pseudonocardiaceae bacterium]